MARYHGYILPHKGRLYRGNSEPEEQSGKKKKGQGEKILEAGWLLIFFSPSTLFSIDPAVSH